LGSPQFIEFHGQDRISYWQAMITAAADRAGCSPVREEMDGQEYNAPSGKISIPG